MTPTEKRTVAPRLDEETRALFDPYVNEALRHQARKLEPHPESLRIELSEIRRDGGTQPRAAINLHHVRLLEQQIIETGGEIEPVIVFYDGVDYWLADGFHRVQAHHNLDKLDINCVVCQGTRRDAVLFSCGANAEHKAVLARSRDDKKRAVMMLLNDAEWSQWSDREIARRCKVDNKTVAYWRAKQSPQNLTEEILSEEQSEEETFLPPKETETRKFKTKHGTISQMKVNKARTATETEAGESPGVEISTPTSQEENFKQRISEVDKIMAACMSVLPEARVDHAIALGERLGYEWDTKLIGCLWRAIANQLTDEQIAEALQCHLQHSKHTII